MEPISTIAAGLGYGLLKKILEKKSISLYDSLEKKFIEAINDNINRYLGNQMNYYSQMKTVLTSNIPKPFRDIYYPLSISTESEFGESAGREKISECSIENIFKYSNYVLIYGDAGSGKSSIVKHLFLGCIEQEDSIPILIEFRHLNTSNVGFIDYIFRNLLNSEIKNNEADIKKLLHSGVFTFFFDGYDEINPEFQEKIVNELQEFIKTYNTNKFIITTRPYSNIEYLPQFHNYKVEDLKDTDIKPFTEKQMNVIYGSQRAEEYAEAVTNLVLKSKDSPHIKSFMRNPLLLSFYILTFQHDASLPPTKSAFYARVINVLLSEHDALSKLNYNRIKKTKLTNEELTTILGLFSYLTYVKAFYEWSYEIINRVLDMIKRKVSWAVFNNEDFIHDMKVSISLWVEESGRLKFAHRSLQEYFVALYMKNNDSVDKYENFFRIFKESRSSIDFAYYHNNVFNLCKELDFVNINKNFILPFLENVINKIKPLKGREFVEACFNLEVRDLTFLISTKVKGDPYGVEMGYKPAEEYSKLKLFGNFQDVVTVLHFSLAEDEEKINLLGNILTPVNNDSQNTKFELEVFSNGRFLDEFWNLFGVDLINDCENYVISLEKFVNKNKEILRQKESVYFDFDDSFLR